jgi:hypothetical protein
VLISDSISVQFKYNIPLITALNKSYFGSLRIRDFRAGCLERLKMKKDFILPVTNKLAREKTGFGSASSCALPLNLLSANVSTWRRS